MRVRTVARNGGNITPPLYDDYLDLKKKHGVQAAKQIMQLQFSRLAELIHKDVFEGAKEKLGHYLEELPSEKGGWGTIDGPAGMQLADETYSSFRLYTHTPCLSIHNIVHTPRGDIRAKHIVHATNGWTPYLLALMREKIVPVRGHIIMTAQRAGTGSDDGWLGTRSFVLYPSASEDRWDYLTQQPHGPTTLGKNPHAEFMFGGGIEMGT
ncbi:hypothetical protein EV421DRAFT_2013956 [Armillaria borealis]|uniref:FAD dependent oxidoreductase domain-containing protein n=1 Tax=Armillaria borealis TaxID=47425 RepID=A0AA39N3N5_9AGAR|nr:hypothetical protein EV421DRAFT_2013956 [Armillaria borealis]